MLSNDSAAGSPGVGDARIPIPAPQKKRLKQSAMLVNFDPGTPLDEICRAAANVGCKGMDLVPPRDWPTLRKYNLLPTICPRDRMTIEDGMLRRELHDDLAKSMCGLIEQSAKHQCPNVITTGGQRRGISYQAGADICVDFLNRVKAAAEDAGVTICMEIMNSRYTQPELGRVDQICDHVSWGVQVCERVNSPRVKLLFDIYHVQIMDGDICNRIRENIRWIGHIHTGGVPGRHELDHTQELNYRFIAQTIADVGFEGYVGHEHRPTPGRDAIQSLAQAVEIMDV